MVPLGNMATFFLAQPPGEDYDKQEESNSAMPDIDTSREQRIAQIRKGLHGYSKDISGLLVELQRKIVRCDRRPTLEKAQAICSLSKSVMNRVHTEWCVNSRSMNSELGELRDRILPDAVEATKTAIDRLSDRDDKIAGALILENVKRRLRMTEVMIDPELTFQQKKKNILDLFPDES